MVRAKSERNQGKHKSPIADSESVGYLLDCDYEENIFWGEIGRKALAMRKEIFNAVSHCTLLQGFSKEQKWRLTGALKE